MTDGWSRRYRDGFDERHHACGCVTFFDVARWRSVAVKRCKDHAEGDE